MSKSEVDKAIAKLTDSTGKLKAGIKEAVERSTMAIRKEAMTNAPKFDGRIISDLTTPTFKDGGLVGIVGTKVFYAPYVEFGTKSNFGKLSKYAKDKTPLDTEMRAIAEQFKGSAGRGDKDDAEKQIKKWAKKKGIDEDTVGGIVLNILSHGIKMQPFLYPAAKRRRPVYMKQLKLIINKYSAK
jgi:HK97 gp10 family phage protein